MEPAFWDIDTKRSTEMDANRRSLSMPLCCPFSFLPFLVTCGHSPRRRLRYRGLWHTSGIILHVPLSPSLIYIATLNSLLNLDLLRLPTSSSLPVWSSELLAQFVLHSLPNFQIDTHTHPAHSGSSAAPGHCSLLMLPAQMSEAEAENLGSERFPSESLSVTRNSKHLCETGNNNKTACKQRACVKTKPRGRKLNGIEHKSGLFFKSAGDTGALLWLTVSKGYAVSPVASLNFPWRSAN